MDHSSRVLDRGLVAADSSPSQRAARREQAVLLAHSLQQLPEDYREVIILLHMEGLTFPEAARQMGRSLDHRPILARRPTLLERATKWGRRHRSVVVSAVVNYF